MLTNNVKSRLHLASSESSLKHHLCAKYSWTATTYNSVDWEHLGYALEARFRVFKTGFARTVKFMYNIQNMGTQKKQYTCNRSSVPLASDLYPCCMIHEETTMHLYQCSETDIRELLVAELRDIEDILQKRHFPPDMWDALNAGIQSYCDGGGALEFVPRSRRAARASASQSSIGWHHLLKGRLSKD